MSENQATNVARQGAGRNQQANRGAQPRVGAAQMQLNPERAPSLIAKWQKLLGKDLDKIEVCYDAESVSVYLYGKEGTPYYKENDDGDLQSISVPRYKELKAEAQKPTTDEALNAFRDKFELRLNIAFPATGGPASGSESDIRQFLNTLPLHQRRAMLMSNKQFKSAYPNGVPEA